VLDNDYEISLAGRTRKKTQPGTRPTPGAKPKENYNLALQSEVSSSG